MDEQAIRKILEGGGGSGGRLVRAVLRIPGFAYGTAMRLRRLAYEHGIFRSFALEAPVISVGNLTAGGSGKTPMVVLLCRMLRARSMRPGVLLRGYRAEAGLSDEAELYRRLLPGVPVEEGADRVAAAIRAVARGANVLVMDDGFQHLKLRRDLDIVLVDALSPWGGGSTIPGGLLREPRSALSRAGAVVVTRSDQVSSERLEEIVSTCRRLASGAALFTARHRPNGLVRPTPAGPEDLPLAWLLGRSVVALCGIARPEAFAMTLEGLGATVIETLAAADHRGFATEFLALAAAKAARRGAALVVTEKDAVKKSFRIFGETADMKEGDVVILGVGQELDDPAGMERLLAGVLSAGAAASRQLGPKSG